MFFIDPSHLFLQIANQTLPTINIPATLTPTLGSPSSTALDVGSITGIVGIISAAGAALKNHLDDKKQDTRTNALADNNLNLTQSLKATDIGVKDNANATQTLVQTLAQHPDLNKLLTASQNGVNSDSVLDLIKSQSDGWDKSIKEYYDNQLKTDNSFSKDPVINKTAAVDAQTVPTPSH